MAVLLLVTVYNGGVIYSEDTATITNCTFTGNTAEYDAGVIYNEDNVTITNCTFTGNSGHDGGVMHDEDQSTITNCNFTGNSAYEGGAIYNCCGTETIKGCIFTNNHAANVGGAIYNYWYLTANYNRIVGNTADNGANAVYGENGYDANVDYNW